MTDNRYGTAPLDLGLVNLSPTEMMFWLYCPIKRAGETQLVIPDNLRSWHPLILRCKADADPDVWKDRFVYVTAKTIYTTPDNTGQRPGWHCDGFMTDDINYIWADKEPTLFWVPGRLVGLPQNHAQSMKDMEELAYAFPQRQRTYPLKHLLRLDETVIHRVNDFTGSGMRSFFKLSISRHPFNLVGNSVNYGLQMDWQLGERGEGRNPEVMQDHVKEKS